MPARKSAARGGSEQQTTRRRSPSDTSPAFPYTTRPGALRKFLAEVPRRPRPAKINRELIASWGISNAEAASGIVRVLRDVGLTNSSNEPTDAYTAFMHAGTGPAVLGQKIREVYAPLFGAALEPHKESAAALKNLFNIHSGGAAATIELQIQTFKALCDYADFSAVAPTGSTPAAGAPLSSSTPSGGSVTGIPAGGLASIHIDLHIHLPENKSSREYQYIIQDIARFIYRSPEEGAAGERE